MVGSIYALHVAVTHELQTRADVSTSKEHGYYDDFAIRNVRTGLTKVPFMAAKITIIKGSISPELLGSYKTANLLWC
jgi:hypothetical protein